MHSQIIIQNIFDCDELSPYLTDLLTEVMSKINAFIDLDETDFSFLYEGRTSSGEIAEVTEDGDLYIDTKKLKQIGNRNAETALLAHECAHIVLRHYATETIGLEKEDEADELAASWGFDITLFRKLCGPATVKKYV